MATTIQDATAHPQPRRPVRRTRTVLVVSSPLPPIDPLPEDCMDCGQTAVAFDSRGRGWCTAHAPLELLCH